MNPSQETATAGVRSSGSGPADWADHFTAGRLALLIVLLLFIEYPEVILGGHSFFNSDFGLFTYPVIHYLRDSIRRGEIPLWNPLNNCGVPFLAQWNTTVCYPPCWLCALFPLPWSLNCLCLGHLVLAGVGAFRLARRWTGDPFAASVAGLAFALNGLTFNCLMWTSNLAALAWMPLVVLWVERAWREGGRCLVLASLAGAVQLLAGAPEIIFLTWLLLGTLWLGQIRQPVVRLRTSGSRFALVVALVCGICAAQLLPFFQLLRYSDRNWDQNPGAWSMPSWGWANFIVPLFRCSRSILGPYYQTQQQWTSSYYTGIGILALAAVSVWRLKAPRVRWLATAALGGIILALGANSFLYAVIKCVFPGIGLARYPIKFIVPTIFALPLLAAFALKQLRQPSLPGPGLRTRNPIIVSASVLLALLVGILVFARVFPYPDESWRVTLENGSERAAFLLLIASGVCLLRRPSPASKRAWLGLGIMLLLGLDALTHLPRQNPSVSVAAYGALPLGMDSVPKLGQSRAMVSPLMRAVLNHAATPDAFVFYVNMRRALYEDCNLPENLPKVDGFFSLHLRDEIAVEALLDTPTNFPAGLADFLGASQITSPAVWFAWEPRTTALPWATAGQQPIFADGPGILKALASPQFDPRRTVYLPDEARPSLTATNATDAKIISAYFTAKKVALDVVASQPAMVVVAQANYPCWRATVDGAPTRLWPANYAFQAAEIPAGQHHVEIAYQDRCFTWGAAISAIALTICLLCVVGMRVRRGRSGASARE